MVDGQAHHFIQGHLVWLVPFLFQQIIVPDQQLRELAAGTGSTGHGMDSLEIQNVTLFVQFPDLWTIHLGQQKLSLDSVQDIPQQDMLLPAEVSIVQVLAVQVRRICIEERVCPVIVWDQHLEALAFNHNLLDSGRHLFQLIKQCFNVERLASKTLPGTGVAIS